MKKLLKNISLLLIVILVTTGCGKKEIEVKNGSKVAVSTSKEKITATEYYNKIKEDNIQILVDMIDRSFLEKKYKQYQNEEDEEVSKQIEQIKSYYGSNEETYLNVLRTYFGAESEDDLKDKLRLEFKREKAVDEYIISKLTDKEIKDYYDKEITGQVKASHILIPVNVKENATDEEKAEADSKAQEKAQKIIEKLNKGEKFSKLARKNSKDEATAANGGDLGYFKLDDMVQEFSDAVKDLKKNEYTKEPVKTKYGYHIILKTGEKKKDKLKNIKDDIKEKIKDQKKAEDPTLFYETLMKVRLKYKMKWNDDVLKKAYDDYMKKTIENAKSQNNQ